MSVIQNGVVKCNQSIRSCKATGRSGQTVEGGQGNQGGRPCRRRFTQTTQIRVQRNNWPRNGDFLYIEGGNMEQKLSMISHFPERILMEHTGMKNSLDSKVQILSICSVRTRSRK